MQNSRHLYRMRLYNSRENRSRKVGTKDSRRQMRQVRKQKKRNGLVRKVRL